MSVTVPVWFVVSSILQRPEWPIENPLQFLSGLRTASLDQAVAFVESSSLYQSRRIVVQRQKSFPRRRESRQAIGAPGFPIGVGNDFQKTALLV